ncbi:MAG TPA: hypothetical protein VFR15_12030, partial [Chloroflexia bacterium]|nr:hypothetical protein [Chloroflexia bacterium]
ARKVKVDWKVSSIDYLYREERFAADYRTISEVGNAYRLDDGKEVSRSDVALLVASLDRLYPTQWFVRGHACCHFYPEWAVELVGADGQRVFLTSDSTGNRGYAPWNVLINGRLYAQYDGAIGEALGKLFGGRLAEPAVPTVYEHNPDRVVLATQDLPPQLSVGYAGLVPLYERLEYTANREAGRIEGAITLYRGLKHTTQAAADSRTGRVARINSVTLSPPGKADVSCELTETEGEFEFEAVWRFTCPHPISDDGSHYNIPIAVDGTTLSGKHLPMSGELRGVWGARGKLPLLPPPVEIASAIPSNPEMADLITDHTLVNAYYTGRLNSSHPLLGTRMGDVMLASRKTVNGRSVGYVVTTEFTLSEGKLARLDLDRAKLDALLDDLIALPAVARVLDTAPNTVLDLIYADEGRAGPMGEPMGGFGERAYSLLVNPCRAAEAKTQPAANQPLWGISFGFDVERHIPQFVLIDGRLVAHHISVGSVPDPVWEALTSAEGVRWCGQP